MVVGREGVGAIEALNDGGDTRDLEAETASEDAGGTDGAGEVEVAFKGTLGVGGLDEAAGMLEDVGGGGTGGEGGLTLTWTEAGG